MKISQRVAGMVTGFALLLGTVGGGVALANTPAPTAAPTQAKVQIQTQKDVQSPSYKGSITVPQSQNDSMSEAQEASALQGQAKITAAQAEAAALAANPGTKVVKTELDNENGALVYSVQLSNGLDVKVDAGNSQILHSEQASADQGGAEQGGAESGGAEHGGED